MGGGCREIVGGIGVRASRCRENAGGVGESVGRAAEMAGGCRAKSGGAREVGGLYRARVGGLSFRNAIFKLRVTHSPEREGAILRWAGDVEVVPGKLRDRMRVLWDALAAAHSRL